MKQVWLVRGSEDGVLGVFSSKKKAMEEALYYTTQGDDQSPEIEEGTYDITVRGNGVYADVEKFQVL